MKITPQGIKIGIDSFLEATPYIFFKGFWKYLIFPFILFGFIFFWGHGFEDSAKNISNVIDKGEYNLGWLGLIWNYIVLGFYSLISFLLLDFTKYLVFVVLSPLLAFISEKVEEVITGNKYEFDFFQLLKDIKRGLTIALIMFVAEMSITYVIWWPISGILGLNKTLYGFGAALIGSFFYGFGFIDYINERLRLTIKESINFSLNHIGTAIIIGGIFSFLFFLPSIIHTNSRLLNIIFDNIGVIIAPVWAIISATIAMHKIVDLNNSLHAINNKK